jgi:hypothetical protein
MENTPTPPPLGTPSPQQQQWGVIISIVIIVCMIVIGAFYAWGKRIAEQNGYTIDNTESTTTAQ